MSEFGNESSTAVLRLGEKSIEALMKLFKFILERKERKVNSELKKEQLNEMKLKSGERIARLKIEGKVGFVKAKLLQRAGEPLVAIKTTMTDQQVKEFSRLAKKYGIPFTSISDRNKTGEKEHTFFVREKDLATAKEITDRMTKDMQLKAIDEKISEINGKGNLSEQDKADIEYLEQQKEEIIHNDTKTFNEENAEIIFNDVCGEMQNKSLSFDKGLNRYTDRDFSRDTPYYLCERTNPTSYIELKSTLDEFAGHQYTRTDYKVYKNEVEQVADLTLRKDGKFTDERFYGRSKGFWQDIKSDMMKKGGFSDDVVVFNNKEEFLRYQQLYKEQQKEITVLEKEGEYRDYSDIIKQLKEQLDKNNAELDEGGYAVNKITKQPIAIVVAKNIEERSEIAESAVIAMQISNYKELSKAQVKLEMDKQQLEGMEQETEEYAELAAEIAITEKQINNALNKEKMLISERNQINGVQAVTEVDKEYNAQKQKTIGNTKLINKREVLQSVGYCEVNNNVPYEQRLTIGTEIEKDVYVFEMKNGVTQEDLERVYKNDERKELDVNTHTLDEWKGQMSERREQITKSSPVADKSIENFIQRKDDDR